MNICVDVLTEENEDGGKRLTESLAQLSSSGKMPPAERFRGTFHSAFYRTFHRAFRRRSYGSIQRKRLRSESALCPVLLAVAERLLEVFPMMFRRRRTRCVHRLGSFFSTAGTLPWMFVFALKTWSQFRIRKGRRGATSDHGSALPTASFTRLPLSNPPRVPVPLYSPLGPLLSWSNKTNLGALAEEAENCTSSPPNVLQARLEEALRSDVAVTTDLRLLVRTSMDALRSLLGDQGWLVAVETVEPVVLRQLQQMVA